MNFTLTATGDKDTVAATLEGQREARAPHMGLKNGMIDHLLEHVEELPDGASSIRLTVSVAFGYSVDEQEKAGSPPAAGVTGGEGQPSGSDQGGA